MVDSTATVFELRDRAYGSEFFGLKSMCSITFLGGKQELWPSHCPLRMESFSSPEVRAELARRVSGYLPRRARVWPSVIARRVADRKSVVEGKRVDLGGRRIINKQTK